MLVLSRKKNEQIVIGNDGIVVTVIEIRGDKVRLGVDAPKHIGVNRKEVHDAIERNKTSQAVSITKHTGQTSPCPDEV